MENTADDFFNQTVSRPRVNRASDIEEFNFPPPSFADSKFTTFKQVVEEILKLE